MTPRAPLALFCLTLAFAAGTLLGWWAVPATAVLWGALRPSVRRPAGFAALAASLAWAGWIVADGIAGNSAFGVLTARLSVLMELPAIALVLFTLGFAAVLAWSAAVIGLGAGDWVLGAGSRRFGPRRDS